MEEVEDVREYVSDTKVKLLSMRRLLKWLETVKRDSPEEELEVDVRGGVSLSFFAFAYPFVIKPMHKPYTPGVQIHSLHFVLLTIVLTRRSTRPYDSCWTRASAGSRSKKWNIC